MEKIGQRMAENGWMLSSGNCIGPDQAFARGANKVAQHLVTLWLPWPSYELSTIAEGNVVHHAPTTEATTLADKFHPQWNLCTPGTKKLHARNMHIILGQDLKTPVDRIICWTPHGQMVGGTSQALRAAKAYKIPIYNIAVETHLIALIKDLYDK